MPQDAVVQREDRCGCVLAINCSVPGLPKFLYLCFCVVHRPHLQAVFRRIGVETIPKDKFCLVSFEV